VNTNKSHPPIYYSTQHPGLPAQVPSPLLVWARIRGGRCLEESSLSSTAKPIFLLPALVSKHTGAPKTCLLSNNSPADGKDPAQPRRRGGFVTGVKPQPRDEHPRATGQLTKGGIKREAKPRAQLGRDPPCPGTRPVHRITESQNHRITE